jgi:hypothetical protein
MFHSKIFKSVPPVFFTGFSARNIVERRRRFTRPGQPGHAVRGPGRRWILVAWSGGLSRAWTSHAHAWSRPGIPLGEICGLAAVLAPLAIVLPAAENARLTESAPAAALSSTQSQPSWSFTASLAVKETYDGNVFIQDHGSLANRESMVTTLLPAIGLSYKASTAFTASATYVPETVFYHSESSEDYVAHRGNLNFAGQLERSTWELLNGLVWIDGNRLGPNFMDGGDIPAIGGIPLRDRRSAAIYRNSFKWTQTLGKWFIRPNVTSYVHDFHTEQHARTGALAGYENYISRYDLNGGLDLGYAVAKSTWIVLGYRYGHQQQKELLGQASPESNDYQRFLAGFEGAPLPWMKWSVLAGPDVRNFSLNTPVGFDRHEMLYYVDAALSLSPGKADTVTLKATRYEQPAFSSCSVYEDIKYDLSWRHKFNKNLTAGWGFTVYGGDWQAPVNREDWIYTPNAAVTWAVSSRLTGELAYSYDWVDSRVPNTSGREFTRHLVSLSLKYRFQ